MDTQLDPTVVNLAKAIRQTESGGNFNAKGKSGEVGAYQFTPDTWNAVAPKYGITVPIDQATPQQQNAVAYNRIKSWKDAKKNVTQIASMWNAGEGEPDAYTGKFATGTPSIGKNKMGVDFNVPEYAKKVSQQYLTYKNGGSSKTDNTQVDPTQAPEVKQHITDMFDQGKNNQDVQDYLQSVKTGGPAPENSTTTPVPPPEPGYMSQVGDQFAEGGQHIVSSIEKGGDKLSEGYAQVQQPGVMNKVEGITKMYQGGAQSFLGTFGGALQTVLSPITPEINNTISDVVNSHPMIETAVNTISKPLNSFAEKNPEEAGIIGDGINALLAAFGEKIGGNKIKTGGGEIAKVADDTTAMTDRIMPKPTQREAALAMREGRLTPAGKGGLFTEGTEGSIAPTPKQIQAGQDIINEIPGAKKMSDPELFTATKKYVETESKRLYPELQKTTIKPEDFNKAITDAENLQKVQAKQTSLLSDRNLQKIQNNFEDALFNLEGKSGADAWDATKAYDDTFKDSVKSATRQSSDLAQEEKDLWLSNRKILTDLRDSTGAQLEGGSKESFRKMSSMYEAQRGLITEAKSNLKAQPSKFDEWKANHPGTVKTGKVIKAVGEGAGIIGGAKIIMGK